ncbi:MAG TPA: magnesium transporter [Candidatus Aerophobetes bacterium]|uniref:Magnesium transporter MgtE n=2 Tax=root TaxID=1 RepID=A0A7C1RKJ0_UNCAE|nr:magnesium transporter [Candidatus Aerophobetes bacterium]
MTREFSRMLLVLPEIKELLWQNKKEQLKKIFYDYEPIEIVEILKEFSLKDKVFLFSLLHIDFAADIFEKTDKDDQLTLLGAFDKTRKAEILDEVAPDERVDFFEQLPEEMVLRFLSIMEEEEAQDVRELMRYDKNTAGGRMTTDFAQIEKGITVEETLRSLRKTAKDLEMIYYIYIADRTDKLLGVVSLKDLIIAQPEREIDEIMHTKLIAIPINMDQEQVAKRIARYDFLALPVIDKEGKIKGIITVDDLIDVIREEDTEDMYKFGAAGKHIDNYMSTTPLSVAKHRITWLLILVVTGFISGTIMEEFSFALKNVVSLAFFIPLLMGSGGNAGTQAASVVVRGLAIGEVKLGDIWRVVKKEFLIGITVGTALGILALLRALILQKSSLLGITVGLSMIATVTVATCLGAILPIICEKLGFDPAVVSGPLITTVVDISSLLIYFGIAIQLMDFG